MSVVVWAYEKALLGWNNGFCDLLKVKVGVNYLHVRCLVMVLRLESLNCVVLELGISSSAF